MKSKNHEFYIRQKSASEREKISKRRSSTFLSWHFRTFFSHLFCTLTKVKNVISKSSYIRRIKKEKTIHSFSIEIAFQRQNSLLNNETRDDSLNLNLDQAITVFWQWFFHNNDESLYLDLCSSNQNHRAKISETKWMNYVFFRVSFSYDNDSQNRDSTSKCERIISFILNIEFRDVIIYWYCYIVSSRWSSHSDRELIVHW